jgi:spermidine/putrescine transport system substrate-binding protein
MISGSFPIFFLKFQTGDPARSDNDVYAAVARWGSIGLVYNTTKIDAARIKSYDVLFDNDLAGRIGIYDWYLPNMGILSLSEGNKEPYDLNAGQLAHLQDKLLELRRHVASIQPNPGQVLADLKSGTVWIAPGIGEWAAAALASQGLPFDWAVPPPGGIMWVEAFAIAADSRQPELAKQFVREAMKPANLALLATRKAYYSQVTRKAAYEFIPAAAKSALKTTNIVDLEAIFSSLQFRRLPGPTETEKDWIAVWTRFKSGS